MKKIYTLIFGLCFVFISKAQFPAPYCAEEYASGVEPITLVKFDSINNVTPRTTSVSGTNDHEDYTNLSTTVMQGISYTITLKGNSDGNYTNYYTVFIDWNQDNDFTGVGEVYNVGTITNSTGIDNKQLIGLISVPLSALTGTTRMRVAKHFGSFQTPCNTGGFGEYGQAEDYTLNVIASPNCSGTPPSPISYAPISFCKDSILNLSLGSISNATGLVFQWQCSKDTINWSDIVGATDPSSDINFIDTCNKFRCKITCTNGNQTSYSKTVIVQPIDCGPPPNDDYCSAIELYLDSAKDCRNTNKATSVNDPSFTACSTPNNTTWYKYTPANTGNVIIKMEIPKNDSLLNGWVGVYTVAGSCPGGLTFTNVTSTVLGGCKSFGNDTTNPIDEITATLDAGVEYYFMIDGVGGAVGSYCISLITPPNPPANCATNISPIDNAIDQPITNLKLKWSLVPGATSYSIYGGTTNPPTGLITTVNGSIDSLIITGMSYSTTYYWYILPVNSGGSPSGCDINNTFSFTTSAPPPPPSACATNVLPAANAIDVSAPSTTLRWNKVAGATQYDVYLGTVNPPTTTITTNLTDTFFDATNLAYTTDYFWYIKPKNGGGSVSGCDATNTTMFTTMATPPTPTNDDCDSAIDLLSATPVSGYTVSATQTLPGVTCGGFTGTADDDVWYKFTTTVAGDVDIKLIPNGNFDAVLVAYSGDCSNLSMIGCADTSFSAGTEIMHLTGLNANETYYFRVYGYGSSLGSRGTFNIQVSGTALPVNLSKFSGYKNGSSNILQWTTSMENNNKGFNIEKSANGKDFVTVNFVESKAINGNSAKELNYTYIDNNPYSDNTYYRLKQIDKNGKFSFSNVINVKGNKITKTSITDIYPNPAKQNLNIVITSVKEEKTVLNVIDVTGRVVKTLNLNINKGNNVLTVDVSSIQKGVYFIKSSNDNMGVHKFIKD